MPAPDVEESQLHDRESQLREIEEIANLGTWTWDVSTNKIAWSDQLARIYGVAPEDAPTTLGAYLQLIHPDERGITMTKVEEALKTGEGFDNVFRIVRSDGNQRWIRSRGRVESDGTGPTRMTGVCQDITEQKTAEDALTTLAMHDALTGLPERTLFADRLEQALKRNVRSPQLLALLFMDLDRFKNVNDKFGHSAGDEALVAVANRLRTIVRPGDTVARLGGDEFAVLCERVTTHGVTELAQRVVEALVEPLTVGGRLCSLGASVGVALTKDPTITAQLMLGAADGAMYKAKESGGNCFVVVDDDVTHTRELDRVRRSEELQIALDSQQLEVFYQPDIDLVSGVPVGVEALVRWNHPDRGLVGPDEFIRLAEDTGLVIPLGQWVLQWACREVAQWPTASDHSTALVSVNLSAAQLTDPHFNQSMRKVIAESGLDPQRLCLELTESMLMEDVESSIVALNDLKALGVRLAIDDFGTGYSSLSYLRRFPVDVVKIDRSFIAAVGIDPTADAIVAAIVNLAHALGHIVVAEGVETDDQLVAVRALGCDRAQGHYWSPALPPRELGMWAEASHRPTAVQPVSVRDLVVDRIEALRVATGRLVLVEVPSKLGTVVGDPRALKTVFDHLLGNAVTYSPEDRPIVVSAASDRHWVRISVADYGIGMNRDESARCFEQFWQAEAPSGRRRGTGIGLYIVRSLVEAMGGHIAVRSARGKGSTFTVAFPRSSRPALQGGNNIRPIGVGEDSSIREFMRQIGVPNRRGA
jgi:diguanylate cyclase (GGDEF)-like protein/PAS domain S-box-containing protein